MSWKCFAFVTSGLPQDKEGSLLCYLLATKP
uniref:Uncharacterized protein n=1 Tax=Physcomitrium patens TaxID=3218 RepID=A0A2K1IU21_PHYPA|nr:hypothetical protein PHYPA_024700 [Physcomitrium patens]